MEYRAKCTEGEYVGDWQPTEERAAQDARSHREASHHPTEIEVREDKGRA